MTDAGLLPYDEHRHGLKIVCSAGGCGKRHGLGHVLRTAAADLHVQVAALDAPSVRGSWVRAAVRDDGPWAAVVVVAAWVPCAGAFTSTLVVSVEDGGDYDSDTDDATVVTVKLARSRRYGGNARVCFAFTQFLDARWNQDWVDAAKRARRFLEACQEQPGVARPAPAPWLVVPPSTDPAGAWTWVQACLGAGDTTPQVNALVILCSADAAGQLAAHPQHCLRVALRLEELSGDCITVPEAFVAVLVACAAIALLAAGAPADAAPALRRVLARLAANAAVSTTSKPTARTEWHFVAELNNTFGCGGRGPVGAATHGTAGEA
jgi:hypothetical protein